MNDFNCSSSCPMKLDLQKSIDKLTFLKEKCPTLFEIESIDALSIEDLHCSFCLLDTLIDALSKEECECLNRDIILLVMTRSYVQNWIDLKNMQLEAEKLDREAARVLKRLP